MTSGGAAADAELTLLAGPALSSSVLTIQAEEFWMKLTLLEGSPTIKNDALGSGNISAYNVSGLPQGEQAIIACFNNVWRFLRWNDEWHGNWTGLYATTDAALEGLRAELLTVA